MFIHLFHLLFAHVMLAATVAVNLGGSEAGAIITGDGGEGSDDSGEGGEGDGGDDTGADGTDGGDGGTEGDGTDGDGSAKSAQKTEGSVDWRTIPAEVKGHIQEIAKTNPKLANMIQNAVYTSNNFLKEVPGGIKEIRALKTSIEELGGIDEIRTLSATYKNLVDDQEALDTKARQGDASVLDTFAEVAGEGFAKLMPSAMNRWAAMDSTGYSHEMSKIMVNAMREGGLVADLNLAFKMLKLNNAEATKEAVECLNRAAEWANGINKIATTVPEKPKVDPNIAQQQQQIQTERTKIFNEKFSNEFGSWRNREIQNAVATISGGRQLNEYQMNTLGQRIISDIKDRLMADRDYTKNLQRLYDARDMAELQKFTRSRTSKVLPEVTKKAYRSLFSGGAPKKSAPAIVGKDGKPVATKPGTQSTTQVKGWTKVAADKAPNPDAIDNKKTDFKMKFNKQAILKNGSKVYWGDKVPA